MKWNFKKDTSLEGHGYKSCMVVIDEWWVAQSPCP